MRHYVIIPAEKINEVDFNKVLESSPQTCRYSLDGSMTFVKYVGEMPESIKNIPGRSQSYSQTDFLNLLKGEDWSNENPPDPVKK